MPGNLEASREVRLGLDVAAGHLEDFVADGAAEVMVMFFAADLVPRGLARNRDGGQPLFFDQRGDVAIDGRDADALDFFLGVGQRFFRRQRAVRADERGSNRVSLSGVSKLDGQDSSAATGQ